ncbi:MAG: hypothetical protein NTW28_21705, partial [Candidatus Solibacter sp.]|nr:hypothetical protein [Candidatus Solibacter sp.]
HTGADGLNYRNENSLEKTGDTSVSSGDSGTASKPSSSGGGFLCITASCLGSPQKTADGLKAVPYAYGNLDPYSFNRFFNAGWTVSSGDKVVGSYGDVRLLGGGLYAAKEMNGYGYRVYNSAGKSLTQIYPDVQSLGGTGYFAVTGIDGIGMTTIMDKNLKAVHSVATYDLNNYVNSYGFQQEVQKREALVEPPPPETAHPTPAPSQKTISAGASVPRQPAASLSNNLPPKAADRGGVKADIKIDEHDFAPSTRRQK